MMEKPWVDFDAIREQCDLVTIPTGALEVYGQHLPAGTDTIVITHIARRVGEQLGAPILPALPVGFSRPLGDFPETLMAYVQETAESVISWGFKRVLFLNSHRGNIGPIGEVAMELQAKYGVACALVADIVDSAPHANGHASEIGTPISLSMTGSKTRRRRTASHIATSFSTRVCAFARIPASSVIQRWRQPQKVGRWSNAG